MAILIKGMKMPDCCWNCPLLNCDDKFREYCAVSEGAVIQGTKRKADCPLVEVSLKSDGKYE